MCSVNLKPCLPSFCAASRAACSTSSGMPLVRGSSTMIENALVASRTFSENLALSFASSSWMAAKRAFLSAASSAPLRRKSRTAFSMIFLLARFREENSFDFWSSLYFANSASFCPSSVQYWVIFGRLALYASRSAGLSITACKCETWPQARPILSLVSSSGATNASQVGGALVTVAIAARPCASSSSIADATWAGSMSANRGRPEKSSSGLLDTVLQQHGDGHGSDASRYRGDRAGDFLYRVEIDVAGELAVRQAVHADVDHAGTWFDHRRGDEFCLADGGDQDIGAFRFRSKICRLG